MEQKRTLWIIAATGVFLLVVLGAALIMYAPSSRTSQTIASNSKTENTSANGWISLAPAQAEEPIPLAEEEPEVYNNISLAQDGLERNIIEGSDAPVPPTQVPSPVPPSDIAPVQRAQTIINNTTTIDLTSLPKQLSEPAKEERHELLPPGKRGFDAPSRDVNKDAANAPRTTKKETAVESPKVAASRSAPKKSLTAPTSAKTTAKAVPSQTANTIINNNTVVKAAPKAPVITKYWVQVTSLTSRKNADVAREELGKHQITADVFTYTDAKGKLFYRVRVGPYTTKSEAEYWQKKISAIDTFKNTASYVTSAVVEQ